MAHNMNKDGDHFLNQEYCFFDGKHKRCRNFTTLTASVYHPLLRKQIPLAVMESEAEDSHCVLLFWNLFQEALRKVLSRNNVSFNPTGWCTDMAGANLIGIRDVFGTEALKRVKTCEFHFKQNRNKMARRLDNESAEEFKEKCDALLHAQTADGYTTAWNELESFIKASPNDRDFLVSWLKWWDDRKEFIFNAFTPIGPRMNQAEVIHAGWAHRDRSNLSLLDAAHRDTRDSILVEAQLKEFRDGKASGGTGPSFNERNYRREIDQAVRYGREINELGGKIDGKSAHRPPTERRKGKKASGGTSKSSEKSNDPPAGTSSQVAPIPPTISSRTESQTEIPHAGSRHSSIMPGKTFPYLPPSHLSFPSVVPPNSAIISNCATNFTQTYPPPPRRSTYSGPFLHQSTSTLSTQIWHSGMSPYQYELTLLPWNVRKCYGCGQDFAAKYRQHPHNIIVKHIDRRLMRKDCITGSLIYSADFTNTYYHANSQHIQRKNPLFAGLVRLPSSLYASLSNAQKQVLENIELNVHIT